MVLRHTREAGVAHRHDLRYTSDCNEHDDPPDKYHVHLQNTRLQVEYRHCLHLWDFSLRVCVTPQSTRAVCGVSGSTQDDPRRLIEPTGKRAADEIITSAIWPLPTTIGVYSTFHTGRTYLCRIIWDKICCVSNSVLRKKRCKDQRNAHNWVKSSRLTSMQTFSVPPPSSSSPTTHFESKLINSSVVGDDYCQLTFFVAGLVHAHPPRPHRLPVRLSTLLHIHAKFKCNYNSKQIPFKALTTSLTPPPIHVNWSSLFWNDIQQCLFQNLSMEKYHSPWYMYCIDSRSKVYWQFLLISTLDYPR